jgi:hypothetical protein
MEVGIQLYKIHGKKNEILTKDGIGKYIIPGGIGKQVTVYV